MDGFGGGVIVDIGVKQKKKFNIRQHIIMLLRRGFLRSAVRYEAIKRAKVGPNQYKCEQCGEIFRYKDINVDHILPIVDVRFWDGYEEVIKRLWCLNEQGNPDSKGLKVMCKKDHAVKTADEREQRKYWRQMRKKNET